MKLKDKLTKFLESEEGQKSLSDFVTKMHNENSIMNSQLERFNEKFSSSLKEIVNKVVEKYHSNPYIHRWHKRHIEPPMFLYWFLFFYAEKYGREATIEEYKEHGNMFTSAMFYINGFYFGRMDGQGSVIFIYEKIASKGDNLQ